MAHFARIQNGIVSEVIAIANQVLFDENGIEQESIGSAFCNETFGGDWIQTSYNGKFKGAFAQPGFIWDGINFAKPESTEEVV